MVASMSGNAREWRRSWSSRRGAVFGSLPGGTAVSPAGVTPRPGRAATIIYMGAAGDRGGGWPQWARQIAAVADVPHAPAVAGALLALAAMTEAIARGAGAGMSVAGLVGVGALAASTTVPLAFLGPVAAAVAISAASALSLAAFGTLTVAGLAAQLIVLYRLGRNGGAAGRGPVPGAGPGPAVPGPRAGRHRAGGFGGTSPGRVAGLPGPGGRPGRDRPAGARRGGGAQRRPAGRRRHPERAHWPAGNGRASPANCTTWSRTTYR